MKEPSIVAHSHQPIYRVIRAGWKDPLDSSFSVQKPDRRWNTSDFPALYCCCGELVARAVALDRLDFDGVVVEDLDPAVVPQIAEIAWQGEPVDVVSAAGIEAAGFPLTYPDGVEISDTQQAASRWFRDCFEGVVCRSASMRRLGFSDWSGPHERWSEVAIWDSKSRQRPKLLNRRTDLRWLFPEGSSEAGDLG